MFLLQRLSVTAVIFSAVLFTLWYLPRALNPTPPSREKREENERWVDTSPYWLDRQSCRWLGLCGLVHVRPDPPVRPDSKDADGGSDAGSLELRSWPAPPTTKSRSSTQGRGDGGSTDDKQLDKELRGIPDYVLRYAPLVHLSSDEHFWPSDMADHVQHMAPYVDDVEMNRSLPLTLDHLHRLDLSAAGRVYLKSRDDVESRPHWLHSSANTPRPFPEEEPDLVSVPVQAELVESERWLSEATTWFEVDRDHPLRRIADPRKRPSRSGASRLYRPDGSDDVTVDPEPDVPIPQHKPDDSGYSRAPATLVLVDKGSGVVDAFWFFFYAFNFGQTVLGMRFGNHVGDWEHCLVRFESGVPRAVFFSEHEGGQAYAWHAVEKRGNATQGQRPVIYSAVGSHAMYAAPGRHPYVLPFNMLKDVTDRGPLWDPTKNLRAYWYDYTAKGDGEGLEPAKENPHVPTDWFHYEGPWGDKLYGLDDKRQWRLFGQYHYVTGPNGPKFKNLGRERVCQTWSCRILHSIAEGKRGSWHS